MTQGYRKYSQAYQKAAVNTMDQRKLIVMLYDGAIRFLTAGANKLRDGDYYESHINMVKGKSVIAELLSTLNLEQGGDIAANLQRLYAYMFNELIDANLGKDAARVERVVELLRELREAWKELPPVRGAGQPSQAPSTPAEPGGPGRNKTINLRG